MQRANQNDIFSSSCLVFLIAVVRLDTLAEVSRTEERLWHAAWRNPVSLAKEKICLVLA
jgi:hypothetical protein